MARVFSVTDYGASGDGSTKETAAIQKAIDACGAGGGGVVFFPAGTYVVGTLFLRDHVTLRLDAGSVLRVSEDREDFFFAPLYEGRYSVSYPALIYGKNVRHICITGDGSFDGMDKTFWTPKQELGSASRREARVKWIGNNRFPDGWRPMMVILDQCQDVVIRNVTFEKSPSYALWMIDSERIGVHGVTVQHNFHGPNTDGCHLSSCRFVRVSDCHFHTGDDCIAIDGGGTKPAEHIVINNCTFRTLTNMCRIYTNIDPWHLQEDAVVSGEEVVRHIAISNCTVADASSALNIVARKGTIEHIVVSNLTLHMELPGTPIFIMTDEGTIRHVSFEHITATANGVCTVSAKSGDVIDGIRMSNCHFGIQPLHKIYGLGFPDPIPKYWDSHEAPHGIFLRHAKGVHLHNVSVQWLAELPGEQWSALWALDIARLNVTGFSALHVGKEPVIRLIGAPKATLHRLQALTASPVFLQVDKVTQEGLSLAPSDGLAMVTDEADTCAEESDAVFCYQVRR